MWCLRRDEDHVYILPNQRRSFGKTSDIKLEGDITISRLHAIVSVELNKESEVQYRCVISDLSKYGTYILRNEEKKKVLINKKFNLEVGDKIQFGLKNSIFIVTFHPFITARSNLNEEEMEKLRTIIKFLGGTLYENWHISCTHLTVSENIIFTTKLAYAMASAKSIVTIGYWEAIKNAVEESKELPRINDFLPTMKEEWLHVRSEMFLPKQERTTLFRGLSFVHFCKHQYFTYAPLITTAGGKSCVYPTRKPLTPRDLTAKNAIVIQQPVSDSTQLTQVIATDYPIIYSKLNALKRRMISDSEIPLAILHCSTEKYCNPKFNFGSFLKSNSQEFSSSDVIIEDTQDVSSITDKRNIQNKKQHVIIPETCDIEKEIDFMKKTHFSNKSEKRDISESRKNEIDIVNNISSNENHKQFRIISETCVSFDKSVASDYSSGQNSEKPQIIPETCEESITSNFSVNKQQQGKSILQENVELQLEKPFVERKSYPIFEKDNLILERNNLMLEKNETIFEKNDLIFEKSNTISGKDNLVPDKTNSVIEKNNVVFKKDSTGQNDGGKNLKSSKGPRIISIEKIDNDNREIHIEQVKEKSPRKDYSKIEEPQNNQLKKRKLSVLSDFEKYQQEDKRTEENEAEERDKRMQKMSQRMMADQYEKFKLNHESMDQILRKDVPCGKVFTKVPALVPGKILKADDFILS